MFLISPYAFTSSTLLIDQITALGLTSGLQLCLDAGDATSYTSGQTWTDRSGNGNSFFRGTTSASQATDPTFNGVAGGASSSEYWSFDGGDYFRETAGHTFANGWHKNNAALTLVGYLYPVGSAAQQFIFSDDVFTGSSAAGINFYQDAEDQLHLFVANDSGSTVLNVETPGPFNLNAWNFFAAALDESVGTNGGTLQINADQHSFTSTYSSPSASDPDDPLTIGAAGSAEVPMASGSRLNSLAAWNRRLSTTELNDLYNATKSKFGL